MGNKENAAWFKQNFGAEVNAAVAGTPFDLDMLTAIAMQETGSIWGVLRTKGLSRERILELCVGDTLDRKKTFPKDKADLVSKPRGSEMFDIARAALIDMSANIPGYKKMVGIPTKFCHGYGLFQYDIQFFPENPDYFLERRYIHFEQTLGRCISELKTKLARVSKDLGWGPKTKLTDAEKVMVAIAYNRGSYDPKLGLKQGHDDGGVFYGEHITEFLAIAKTVPGPVAAPAPVPKPAPAPVPKPVPAPAPVGEAMLVATQSDPLNVRTLASKTAPALPDRLPKGHPVTAFEASNGFRRITATLNGKAIAGWAWAELLKKS